MIILFFNNTPVIAGIFILTAREEYYHTLAGRHSGRRYENLPEWP
jgi:hypothetical protein